MSRDRCDVLVSGAGAAGAVTALALAKAGFSVTVVETREPPPAEAALDLRVVALSPASIQLLTRLDLWPLPPGKASPYRTMEVTGSAGTGRLVFDAADIAQPALGAIVEMRALQARAFDALRARVALRVPERITEVRAGDDAIEATLSGGARLRARLLVVAEGEHSGLRESLGITTRGRDYASAGIVCHLATEMPNPGIAFQRFGPGGPLAFLPLAEGHSSLVWTRPQAEVPALMELSDADFAARLLTASAGRFGTVRVASARAAFPLRLALADDVIAARTVLIGDAAHRVHPLAGLGLNLGLQDAGALADVLDAARLRDRDIGGRATLKRYQAWRQSDAEATAGVVDAIERGFRAGDESALPRWLQRGLGWLDAVAPAKTLLARAACGQVGRVPSLMRVGPDSMRG